MLDTIGELTDDLLANMQPAADGLRQLKVSPEDQVSLEASCDAIDTSVEQAERLQSLLDELRRRWDHR